MLFVFNQCKTIANACNGNKTKMSKLTYVQNRSVVRQKITASSQNEVVAIFNLVFGLFRINKRIMVSSSH